MANSEWRIERKRHRLPYSLFAIRYSLFAIRYALFALSGRIKKLTRVIPGGAPAAADFMVARAAHFPS
jgi:hypothetical protein